MPENASLTRLGFAGLTIALVLIAIFSWHFGGIEGKRAFEELFSSSVEVLLEACIAGGVIWWYQRRQAVRAEKATIERGLIEIRTQVAAAGFLMSSHRSGLTWGNQMRILIGAIARIEELKYSLEALGTTAQLKKALRHMSQAEIALNTLKKEYHDKHEDVDKDQDEFQQAKKARKQNLEAHWAKMLAYLPQTNQLVINERSKLLTDLREAAEAVAPSPRSRMAITWSEERAQSAKK